HQAKNNLQILTSLFRMDSARIRATETGDGLQAFRKQATDRVVTMALIQDHIFNLGVGEAFDTKPFIEELIDLIDNGLGGEHVVVNKDIQSINMDYHLATPLGLIISEILTNAYKHAFSDKSGEISIDFREDAGVGPTLTVSDSGKGFDVDETRDGSKGLNLIELLAEQLSAQCNVETKQGSGTTWNIGPIPTVRTP
ncbi:MAG: sensor histidine kinase, partial [Pseudomonadota bacterium]